MNNRKIFSLTLVMLCLLMPVSMLSCKWFKSGGGDKKMSIAAVISMPDIVRSLSARPSDSTLNKALDMAQLMQKNDSADFMKLFEKAWNKTANNIRMVTLFARAGNTNIALNASDQEVIQQLNKAVDVIIDRSIFVTQTRLESLGCKVVGIHKAKQRAHINIELEEVANPRQVLNLIQYAGNLQFWETYEYHDIYSLMVEADAKAKALLELADSNAPKDPGKAAKTNMRDVLPNNSRPNTTEVTAAENPLFALLVPTLVQDEKGNYYPQRGPCVGYCHIADTAKLNHLLRLPQIARVFPTELHFAWGKQPAEKDKNTLALIALKADRNGKPAMDVAGMITDARQEYNSSKQIEVSIAMNSEGAGIWKDLTANNIGKSLAIVLDAYVYSYPTVQAEIPNGRSSITGNFTETEAKDLASILKAGKLPARIIVVDAVTHDKDGNIIPNGK